MLLLFVCTVWGSEIDPFYRNKKGSISLPHIVHHNFILSNVYIGIYDKQVYICFQKGYFFKMAALIVAFGKSLKTSGVLDNFSVFS